MLKRSKLAQLMIVWKLEAMGNLWSLWLKTKIGGPWESSLAWFGEKEKKTMSYGNILNAHVKRNIEYGINWIMKSFCVL